MNRYRSKRGQAEIDGYDLITELVDPAVSFDTQWGPLTGFNWCLAEARRMNSSGRSVVVIRDKPTGHVAIARRKPPAGNPTI